MTNTACCPTLNFCLLHHHPPHHFRLRILVHLASQFFFFSPPCHHLCHTSSMIFQMIFHLGSSHLSFLHSTSFHFNHQHRTYYSPTHHPWSLLIHPFSYYYPPLTRLYLSFPASHHSWPMSPSHKPPLATLPPLAMRLSSPVAFSSPLPISHQIYQHQRQLPQPLHFTNKPTIGTRVMPSFLPQYSR